MTPNTHLPYWTATDKGSMNFNGHSFRSYLIQGPHNEVLTILVLDHDRHLVDKIIAALAKAEA